MNSSLCEAGRRWCGSIGGADDGDAGRRVESCRHDRNRGRSVKKNRRMFEKCFFLVLDTSQYCKCIDFTFSMEHGSASLMESIMDKKVGFVEIAP